MPPFELATVVEGYRTLPEDRAAAFEWRSALIMVIADGAGGRSGGAAAAEAVIRSVRAAATSSLHLHDPRAWGLLLEEIDALLVRDPIAGETTAVAAAVTATGIAGASVGDSGAWLISTAGCEDLTAHQDHKPCLGTGMARAMPFRARSLNGTLLLASDGLFKYASDESICAVALEQPIDSAAKRLVDLVRLRSGRLPDDVSVILCRPRP